jgi:flagellar L-ring protein precursor FlgH
MMSLHRTVRLGFAIAVVAIALLSAAPAAAQAQRTVAAQPTSSDNYDVLYARYLESARRTATAPAVGPSIDWISSLGLDRRARAVNDLVTIKVVESIEGAGSADAALDKNSKASGGVTSLFGLTKKLPSVIDPTSLASTASDSAFKGSGTTTRSGTLTATITARVLEVLPNGDLVLEGAREIEINGDRQMVVLTGVCRPRDVSDQNVVLSPAVGQLRIRYFGRGLMKDNLKPGWLVRILNKVF